MTSRSAPLLSAALLLSAIIIGHLPRSVTSDQCPYPLPAPASNFSSYTYDGVWYEIGKIQTAGGAIFESSCVCTELIVGEVANDTTPSDRQVLNSCRQHTPQGAFLNATGLLVDMKLPGAWGETFIPFLPPTVNYTVIALGEENGEEYSVEFDCGAIFGIVNYCVHILSRKPTLSPAIVNRLVQYANNTLGLNIYHLPFNQTLQTGCW